MDNDEWLYFWVFFVYLKVSLEVICIVWNIMLCESKVIFSNILSDCMCCFWDNVVKLCKGRFWFEI